MVAFDSRPVHQATNAAPATRNAASATIVRLRQVTDGGYPRTSGGTARSNAAQRPGDVLAGRRDATEFRDVRVAGARDLLVRRRAAETLREHDPRDRRVRRGRIARPIHLDPLDAELAAEGASEAVVIDAAQ